MRRALALFFLLGFVALFALLNWNTFVTPTALNVGVTTVNAPLGLIMLGIVAFLSLVFVVWTVSMQAGALSEARRLTKDLNAQRELADKAESSRFTELRTFLVAELQNIASANEQGRAALRTHIDQVHEATRAQHEEATNALIAQFGELEDRLERAEAVPGAYERRDALVR